MSDSFIQNHRDWDGEQFYCNPQRPTSCCCRNVFEPVLSLQRSLFIRLNELSERTTANQIGGIPVQHREGRSRARGLCGSQAAGCGSSAQMSGDSKGGAVSQCGCVFSGAAVSHRQPIDCCDTTMTVVMRSLRCTMRRERGREVDFGRVEYWAAPTGVQPRANSSTENMGVCARVSGAGGWKTGRQSVCTGCDWPAYRVLRVEPWEGGSFKTMSLPDLSIQGGMGTRWGQQWTSELINFYSALNHQ